MGSRGSIRLRMPSIPAMRTAEKHRYGLEEGSGTRYSMRLALGEVPVTGMRMQAERLRAE